MIILKQQTDEQTLRFIPRSYGADTIILRNETTNEIQTITASFSLEKYYLTTVTSFDLKENTFYNLTVKVKDVKIHLNEDVNNTQIKYNNKEIIEILQKISDECLKLLKESKS